MRKEPSSVLKYSQSLQPNVGRLWTGTKPSYPCHLKIKHTDALTYNYTKSPHTSTNMPLMLNRKYEPVDDTVQRVRAAVMRVGHHQELLISNGKELPVHCTEHNILTLKTVRVFCLNCTTFLPQNST